MLKAVKESLKNWLVTHERLYWYIVVGLAVLGFGIVTAIGCAKLERAEASEGVSMEFEHLYNSLAYSRMTDWVAANVNEGQHYVVFALDQNINTSVTDGIYAIGCIVSDTKTITIPVNGKTYNLTCNYWVNSTSTGITTSSNSYFQISPHNAYRNVIYTLEGDISLVGCFPLSNMVDVYEKPLPVLYDTDAPYVSFEGLGYVNKIAEGDTKAKLFDDIYEDYTTQSYLRLDGKLLNMTSNDLAYELEMSCVVELPNDDYLLQMAEYLDVDLSWERNALNYTPEMVKAWYTYNGTDYSRYKINISMPLTVNERGEFGLEFTFPELEYLLMGDDTFRQRFAVYNGEDNTYWKAILLSYLHLDTVSMSVTTTRSDSIVYGKIRSVRFDRGYGHWTSVVTSADKNFVLPDALENMINSDLSSAERNHLNELENRVDELQNQIDSMNNFDSVFGGELEGSDLWTGFGNLSKGVSSLGPSIGNISSLAGQVFAFIPAPIASIMYFTLFAVCIIAIIKAIRG